MYAQDNILCQFGLFRHKFTTVSQPILNHFRWELYQVPPLWEHSLTTLLHHDPTSDPGIALRQWVHFQGVHNIFDLLSWEQEELKAVPAQ